MTVQKEYINMKSSGCGMGGKNFGKSHVAAGTGTGKSSTGSGKSTSKVDKPKSSTVSGKKVTVPVPNSNNKHSSVTASVRPIENGFIVRTETYNGDKWNSKETYSETKPDVSVKLETKKK
jgi:hypothetical protein